MRTVFRRIGMGIRAVPAVLLVAAVLATSIAIPNVRRAQERSGDFSCFANQRRIAAAMDMWKVDHGKRISELNPEILERLRLEGYWVPRPDATRGECLANYVLVSPGRVFCLRHGFIRPPTACAPGGSPRAQLEATGHAASDLLARCHEGSPSPEASSRALPALQFVLALSVALLILKAVERGIKRT